MDQNTENTTSSIFENVAQILSENSETLENLNVDNEKPTVSFSKNKEWSLGEAPIKTIDDPNFELYKQEFDKGSSTALIDASETPENVQTAVNMLLRAPEFKEFIGQYALSNDIKQNLSTIQRAISNQKDFEKTPERIGEIDGQFFTGGEAYFLQELLNRVQNSDAVNTFFSQLRDVINTEVIQKIENNNKEDNTKKTFVGMAAEQGALNDMLLDPNFNMDQLDALSKTVKLLNEREGEVIEDATRDEIFGELKRIIGSPEYNQARTEELGYDPNVGHPDPEIQDYLNAKKEWAATPYYNRIEKPTPPKNFEQRLNQPKIDYDHRIKEGMTSKQALDTIYAQTNQQPQISPTKELNTRATILPQSSQINQSDTSSFFQAQNKPTLQPESTLINQSQINQTIQPKTPIIEQPQIKSTINPEVKSTIPDIKPISTTDLTETTFPQIQEKIIYETASELPTEDMFVQAEEAQDETSAEILANTQKTNTTLEGLTQLLATFVQQTLGGQAQQPTTIPVPMPTGQSGSSQPGISDAMLASGSGMIPTIRSKFIYSV